MILIMLTNLYTKMETTKQLLKALSAEAKRKGITHQQIADMLGIDQSGIAHLFSGKSSPSIDRILKVMKIIGVKGFHIVNDKVYLDPL